MQHRFSAEPPRIATRGPQVPRTGRAKRVGHWVLQTVMLPGVARNVDNCQKCGIGVRNVGVWLFFPDPTPNPALDHAPGQSARASAPDAREWEPSERFALRRFHN